MGLFSNLTRSWKKSSRLQKLEKVIAPPNQSIKNVISEAMHMSKGGTSAKDHALEDFIDMCESDQGVRKVMEIEHLSRSDLKQLYIRLLAAGLGQWIRGHYAALSTIAYVEPLQYAIRAQKSGVAWLQVVSNLLGYWEGRIPSGELLSISMPEKSPSSVSGAPSVELQKWLETRERATKARDAMRATGGHMLLRGSVVNPEELSEPLRTEAIEYLRQRGEWHD